MGEVSELQRLSATALDRDPAQQAIEFNGRWFSWGEMRHVADRLIELLDACGVDARTPVAFVPRNRVAGGLCRSSDGLRTKLTISKAP